MSLLQIKKGSLGILFYFLYQIRTDLMAPLSSLAFIYVFLSWRKRVETRVPEIFSETTVHSIWAAA